MPNLPSGCNYPKCPCTYPDCATREEREEWRQATGRETAQIESPKPVSITEAGVNITQARRRLLQAIADSGGTIPGAKLGGVGRASASKMQSAGLVTWEQPASAHGQRDLGLWLLHITDAGRAALSGS